MLRIARLRPGTRVKISQVSDGTKLMIAGYDEAWLHGYARACVGEVGRCLLSSTMGPAAGLMGTRRHFAKTGFFGEVEEIQQLKTDIRAQIDVFLRAADVGMLRTKLQQLLKQNRTLLDQQLQRAAKSKTTSLPDQSISPRASKHGRRSSSRGTTRRRSTGSLPTSAHKSADHSQHNTSALRSRSRSTSSNGPKKGISASSDLPPIDSIGTASENVSSSIKLAAAGVNS